MGDAPAAAVLLKSIHSMNSPQVIDPLFNTRLNVSVVRGDLAARAPHHRRLAYLCTRDTCTLPSPPNPTTPGNARSCRNSRRT
jgi:hypothetical protein